MNRLKKKKRANDVLTIVSAACGANYSFLLVKTNDPAREYKNAADFLSEITTFACSFFLSRPTSCCLNQGFVVSEKKILSESVSSKNLVKFNDSSSSISPSLKYYFTHSFKVNSRDSHAHKTNAHEAICSLLFSLLRTITELHI